MKKIESTKSNQYYARDRAAWRNWLKEHHDKAMNVWLVIYDQKSKKTSVTYNDAVEEAISFGWIDSKPNKRDSESYYQLFSKRNPKSNWSKANRDRAEKMIKNGLMTKSGMEMINLAKKNGTWTALVDVQRSVVPPDLKKALAKNKKAEEYFIAFPPSSKRIILEWILNAKKPETRQKRVKETVKLAEKNIRAHHYRQ